jgi:hypothetical protein
MKEAMGTALSPPTGRAVKTFSCRQDRIMLERGSSAHCLSGVTMPSYLFSQRAFVVGSGCVLAVLSAVTFSSPAVAQISYAWANQPSAAEYVPEPLYAYNLSGGRITISRVGIGAYRVRFAGLGGRGKGGGHVQVTPYGDNSDMCKVGRWDYGGQDFVVDVRCFGANGAAVDSRYTILAGWFGGLQPLPAGAVGDTAEPVKRLVLPDGTVEFRYRDGSIRRRNKTCTVTIAPSGRADTACIAFVELPYNLPPLTDQTPRGLPKWIQDQSSQVMQQIAMLLDRDENSIKDYQRTEQGLDLYKQVQRRLALVTMLLEGR